MPMFIRGRNAAPEALPMTLPPAAPDPSTAALPSFVQAPMLAPQDGGCATPWAAPTPPLPKPAPRTEPAEPTGPTVTVGGLRLPCHTAGDKDPLAVPGAEADLVVTLTTEQNLRLLAVAWKRARPALIEGTTSAGKTAAVRYLAYKTGTPYRRINLSHGTDVADLLGRYVGGERRYELAQLQALSPATLTRLAADCDLDPQVADLAAAIFKRQMEPHWVDGPVIKALKRGDVLLLDEINLAPAAVVERLNSLFDDDGNIVLVEHRNEVVRPQRDFRLFATMNPSHYSGREPLSPAMRSRWNTVKMRGMQRDDLWQIMQARFGKDIPKAELSKLITLHMNLAESVDAGTLGRRGELSFTLRNLLKVGHRFVTLSGRGLTDDALMRREAQEIYAGGLVRMEDFTQVCDMLRVSMPCNVRSFYDNIALREHANFFEIGDVRVPKVNAPHALVPDASARLVLTARTKKILYRLAKALEMGENVAFIGERACGKTAIAKLYAHLRGQPYYRQIFSASTDPAQIIGGYDDQGWKDGLLLTCGGDRATPGVFLGDELNLTGPSLLERLNSVLDDERMLVLSEREGEVVRMAADFRFVAAMNPPGRQYNGRERLSAAMQNRFTQIVVPDADEPSEQRTIANEMAHKMGLPNGWSDKLVTLHNQLVEAYSTGQLGGHLRAQDKPVYSLRQLLEALSVMRTFHQEQGAQRAYRLAVETQYAGQANDAERQTIMEWAAKV